MLQCCRQAGRLPTFCATRILILRFFICLFAMSCESFDSCISMVKDSMGRRIQWLVKDSMVGEGINGWKGRKTQWMVQDSIHFISSSCGAHTAFFVAPNANGTEHNCKWRFEEAASGLACKRNLYKSTADTTEHQSETACLHQPQWSKLWLDHGRCTRRAVVQYGRFLLGSLSQSLSSPSEPDAWRVSCRRT